MQRSREGAGCHLIRVVGRPSAMSIDIDLAREGTVKAPTRQGSFANDGIWPKNELAGRKREVEKKKRKKRSKRKKSRGKEGEKREKYLRGEVSSFRVVM